MGITGMPAVNMRETYKDLEFASRITNDLQKQEMSFIDDTISQLKGALGKKEGEEGAVPKDIAKVIKKDIGDLQKLKKAVAKQPSQNFDKIADQHKAIRDIRSHAFGEANLAETKESRQQEETLVQTAMGLQKVMAKVDKQVTDSMGKCIEFAKNNNLLMSMSKPASLGSKILAQFKKLFVSAHKPGNDTLSGLKDLAKQLDHTAKTMENQASKTQKANSAAIGKFMKANKETMKFLSNPKEVGEFLRTVSSQKKEYEKGVLSESELKKVGEKLQVTKDSRSHLDVASTKLAANDVAGAKAALGEYSKRYESKIAGLDSALKLIDEQEASLAEPGWVSNPFKWGEGAKADRAQQREELAGRRQETMAKKEKLMTASNIIAELNKGVEDRAAMKKADSMLGILNGQVMQKQYKLQTAVERNVSLKTGVADCIALNRTLGKLASLAKEGEKLANSAADPKAVKDWQDRMEDHIFFLNARIDSMPTRERTTKTFQMDYETKGTTKTFQMEGQENVSRK